MCQHLLVYLLSVVSFDPPTRRHHIHRTLHGESIKRESCGGVAVTDFVTAVAGRCCWRWVAVRSGWGPPYLYLLLAAHAAAAGRPRGARSDTLTTSSSLVRFELDPANGASTSRPSSSLVALAGGGGGGGSDGGVRASVARGDGGGHSARGTWMDR